MWTIRAVAIGRDSVDTTFDTPSADLSGVRPYIQGLADWLKLAANAKSTPKTDGSLGQYILGTEYKIDYREREVGGVADAFTGAEDADVLFCMSTHVGDAALSWREGQGLETPIVIITSDPSKYDGVAQVCGVSALRPQLAGLGIRKFKEAQSTLTKIWLLHRKNYGPSDQAKKRLGGINVELLTVKDNDDPAAAVSEKREKRPQMRLMVFWCCQPIAFLDGPKISRQRPTRPGNRVRP